RRLGGGRVLLGTDVGLVRTRDPRLVAQPLDRATVQNVRLENLRQVAGLHAGIPHVLRVDDHHGAVAALREAAGLVDAHLRVGLGAPYTVAEGLHESLHVALGRAGLTARTHEHVPV